MVSLPLLLGQNKEFLYFGPSNLEYYKTLATLTACLFDEKINKFEFCNKHTPSCSEAK
jgi:hypothetical protein